ncbi:unnamed protein product [Alternaria sp. RS040]
MKLSLILLIASLIALGATEYFQNLTNDKAVIDGNVKALGRQKLTFRGGTDSDPDDDSDDSDDSDSDDEDEDDDNDDGYTNPATDKAWFESQCRGAKLMFASTQNPPEAIRFVNPLTSPWDGDMKHELATWGYKEDVSDPDGECEIGALQPMLDELKLSKVNNLHGGPNHCFSVFHADSDIVEKDPQGRMPPRKKQYYTANGRRYRVTTAYATIIINPQAGLIYFLRRGSAVKEARDLWRIRKGDPVPSDELPALRASSDLAWGFWNRVRRDKLAEIHGFVSMLITNGETRRIIDRILREQELDRVPLWPGIDVNMNTPQYMALLGSPNGRAVGYFLAQHKAQIGGNRCVKTIRIFRGDAMTEMPNLLFAVEWAPSPPANAPTDPVEEWLPYPDDGMGVLTDIQVGNVVKRSDDGRNMLRSHKVWVKL